MLFFFFNDTATTEIYTLSLHDALPILHISPSTAKTYVARVYEKLGARNRAEAVMAAVRLGLVSRSARSEEHTFELQSRQYLVCRLLLEKKKILIVCELHITNSQDISTV